MGRKEVLCDSQFKRVTQLRRMHAIGGLFRKENFNMNGIPATGDETKTFVPEITPEG